jgi:CHAT domain-containing protein
MGADATKARFEQEVPGARIVHVAAHAQADELDPLRSKIYLADVEGQGDPLDASEVQALDLSRVALVTLSACESARGRVLTGDEILGFSRAFLAAGSDALIASLWPVNDRATELLMQAFYQRLREGDDLQTAFQSAQLSLLRKPILSSPLYWAPFNVMGNWRLALER